MKINRQLTRYGLREKRGRMNYGKTRCFQILRQAGISIPIIGEPAGHPRRPTVEDPLMSFRIQFPAARNMSDEDLLISLGEGRLKAPLPEDWPDGALERVWAVIHATQKLDYDLEDGEHFLMPGEDDEDSVPTGTALVDDPEGPDPDMGIGDFGH